MTAIAVSKPGVRLLAAVEAVLEVVTDWTEDARLTAIGREYAAGEIRYAISRELLGEGKNGA